MQCKSLLRLLHYASSRPLDKKKISLYRCASVLRRLLPTYAIWHVTLAQLIVKMKQASNQQQQQNNELFNISIDHRTMTFFVVVVESLYCSKTRTMKNRVFAIQDNRLHKFYLSFGCQINDLNESLPLYLNVHVTASPLFLLLLLRLIFGLIKCMCFWIRLSRCFIG